MTAAGRLIQAFEAFKDAVSAPRRWAIEACDVCGRPAGYICDLDEHARTEEAGC